MPPSRHFTNLTVGLVFFLIIVVAARAGFADTTTNFSAAIDAEGKTAESLLIGTQETLRSNLQIQAQLHDALLAIEKSRQEAQAAAQHNSELLEARMTLLEKTLSDQQHIDVQDIERSDRMMVIAAGSFAAVGFLVLVAAAFLQWTGANRLATFAAAFPASQSAPALNGGEQHLLASQMLEQTNARFLGIIERLEEKIRGMEMIAAPATQHLPEASSTNGDEAPEALVAEEISPAAATDKAEAIRLLLAKGQTLLKLDKPQEALDCFNEIMVLDPANVEALVKKGAALERLQRLDEAVECYDLAIARDNSMTMAYLYKGGVFNRMERYSEALACYEQALKSQQKGHAANVIID